MKVYIVRHGQVDSNLKRLYNVSDDEDINETGIRQAEELRNEIKNMNFDIVYCSPFLRARHTASIINSKNKKVIIDDRLKERNHGNLMGKLVDCTDREIYWNYYSEIRYGTEESVKDLFQRVNSFLDELKNKEYENVLVVAHKGVSRAFYTYFNGIPRDGKTLKTGLENGEIKKYCL